MYVQMCLCMYLCMYVHICLCMYAFACILSLQAANLYRVLLLNDEHSRRFYLPFFLFGWSESIFQAAIIFCSKICHIKLHQQLVSTV